MISIYVYVVRDVIVVLNFKNFRKGTPQKSVSLNLIHT